MQRRRVLYGMLTAGCAATVPMLFAGCERQEAPPPDPQSSGSAPSGAPPPAPTVGTTPAESDAAEATGAGKLSQVQAQYRDQPNGDQQCANCTNFNAGDNTCKAVEGQISPEGWCTLWNKLA